MLGRIAAMLAPSKQIATNLDPKTLSRDPVVQQEYVDDDLCHDTGTLEGVAGLLDRAAALDSGQLRLKDGIGEGGKTRLWIAHGTGDSFTAYAPVKRMFEAFDIEDKQLKLYNGWSHKREPITPPMVYQRADSHSARRAGRGQGDFCE